MTVAEFIDWPGDGVTKTWQLVDGEAKPMSPAATTHAAIQARIAYLISRHLDDTSAALTVFTEPAIVPKLGSDSNLRVPDVAIAPGVSVLGEIVLSGPLIIIEVLSPSNKRQTRENVWAYASMESVRDILLVESTRPGAELWVRDASGAWPAGPMQLGPDATLTLESIAFSRPLIDLYASTHLAPKTR